jgi:plastocyanin
MPPSLVLVLASLLTACAAGGESPSPSGTAEPSSAAPTASAEPAASEGPMAVEEVRIELARFEPRELTVSPGTEVVFVNEDNYDHTITEGTEGQAVAGAFVNEELPADSTIRVVFDEPGTFQITCIIHPTMQMTITVED